LCWLLLLACVARQLLLSHGPLASLDCAQLCLSMPDTAALLCVGLLQVPVKGLQDSRAMQQQSRMPCSSNSRSSRTAAPAAAATARPAAGAV
jgi:hypothetical protein